MCDRLKLNLGSFCHFDEERLSFCRRHRGQGFERGDSVRNQALNSIGKQIK
jgi:hypothetical protein